MLKSLILFFLIFTNFLYSSDLDKYQATLESEPSAVIEGCVNAITGNFFLNDTDVVAFGKEPIYYKKNYINILKKIPNTPENLNSITPCEFHRLAFGGWEHLCGLVAHIDFDDRFEKSNRRLDIYEPSGVFLSYNIRDPDQKKGESKHDYKKRKNQPRKLNFHISENSNSRSFVNTSKGFISARTNYKNNVVEKIGNNGLRVYHVEGSIKFYTRHHLKDENKPYYLDYEILPNGNTIKYDYNKDKWLIRIRALSPSGKEYSSINIDETSKEIKLDKKKKGYEKKVFVHTHTDKHFEYFYNFESSDHDCRTFVLKYIKSVYGEDKIEYYPHFTFFLTKYTFPKNKPFCIDYFLEGHKLAHKRYRKVSQIRAPFGKNKGPNLTDPNLYVIHRFDYETENVTKVYDAYNNETRYLYEEDTLRLKEIQRYEAGNPNPVNREKFIWGKDAQDGFLLSKIFYDEKNRPIKALINQYDPENKGNIIKKTIYGDISKSGNPINLNSNGLPLDTNIEKQITEYSYFPNNLLSEERDQYGLSIKYTYHVCKIDNNPFQTDLPLTRFVMFNNVIKQRTFFIYDSDNILITEINDDGSSEDVNNLYNVTKRSIKRIKPMAFKPYGFAKEIEEFYLDLNSGKEILLKKEEYEYAKNCKISKKHIYGSDNKYKYTLHYEYDEKDNLIKETDPLARVAIYKYDENNNKTYEKTFEEKEIFYDYDLCNRLTSKTVKKENESYTEAYEHDLKHNKTMQRDIYGNETHYKYNAFDQVVKEIHTLVEDENGKSINPFQEYGYDAFGNQIFKKDFKGNITQTSYNIFGKPTQIIYPNNTKETYTYNLDGTLLEHINQEGTKTVYKYDYLKRVISKKIIPLIGDIREEIFEYDAFDLLKKIDFDGNITKYTYDGVGRKIKEEFFNKDSKLLSIKEIFYDELGFIGKKVKGNTLVTIYKRDFLGRVLEKIKENLDGKILFKKGFAYDKTGSKKTIISYIANKKAEETQYFDVLNRPIKSVDALNNETIISYIPINGELIKQIINPIGQKTIITYDALKREKKVEKKNNCDQLIFKEEKFYDQNGNLSKQKSTIYNLDDLSTRQVTTLWKYDEMNNITQLIEAYNTKDEKVTSYTYTPLGLLEKTITPKNVEIINEYDAFGNKTRIYSSARDIDYFFTYNKLNQVIEAKDINNNFITQRSCDPKNNLLEEKFFNNIKLVNEYDLLNNKTKCIYPDHSSAEYFYDALNLKKIIRKDSFSKILYEHEYLEYDLSKNLMREKLINNEGCISYDLDLLGQVVSIDTKHHIQKITYDKIGRISSITWEKFLDDFCEYKYDDLNQITQETGSLFTNNYLFDSNCNRLKKNEDVYQINDLNQIVTNSLEEFVYDKNGNPIQKILKDGKINYFYDSLDRLIKIEKPNNFILEFTYDPFNRRISKKCLEYSSIYGFYEKDFRYFLYDDQNEIGSCNQNFKLKELRILSDTQNAEIGSAIAFEIDGYVYAPIYDVSGNVVSLIYNDLLYEHYRYSAFGERKIFSYWGFEQERSQINNPWQFSSKRIDEESGLIYFGRRYYEPTLGRWLTCDPKGFKDGMNLYAFVLNDPLIKVDLYGLSLKSFIRKNYSKEYLPVPPADDYPSYVEWLEKYIPNRDPTRKFDLRLPEISKHIRTGSVNGIGTTSKEAREHAKDLSKMMGGYNVHVFYNETYGYYADACRVGDELHNNYKSKISPLLKKGLIDFLSQDKSNYYLLSCHSEGTVITRNVLRDLPEEYRDRIVILAIAPSAYIDNDLCAKVTHLCSKKDIVPLIDKQGRKRNAENIEWLDPHPSAKGIDHNFDSLTYYKSKFRYINNFVNTYKGNE